MSLIINDEKYDGFWANLVAIPLAISIFLWIGGMFLFIAGLFLSPFILAIWLLTQLAR